MTNDQMRAEFEAWAAKEKWPLEHPMRHELLVAWQASRAALCVELPKIVNSEWACTSDECSAMRDAIRFCRTAIESTGVRVK